MSIPDFFFLKGLFNTINLSSSSFEQFKPESVHSDQKSTHFSVAVQSQVLETEQRSCVTEGLPEAYFLLKQNWQHTPSSLLSL